MAGGAHTGFGFFIETRVRGIKEASILFEGIESDLTHGKRQRLIEASKLVASAVKSKTHSRRVRKAITYNVDVQSSGSFWARIGPKRRPAWFAHFLEFGTTHSRAFPFLLPAKQATEERVVEIVGIPPTLRQRRSR